MISIIIVNYNWKKRLKKCFDSLKNQTYRDFEIIMIDNASTDDSISFTKSYYPYIKIIKSDKNLWFAWGNNLWIKHAQWEYIMLLNNDTWVNDIFLERYRYIYQNRWGDILWITEKTYDWIINPNIYPNIDIFWHPIYSNYNGNKNIITELFYTSWVCCLFTKTVYQKTWWLDNDFFMYFEETDWIWRARLYWYSVWQCPDLFVYHAWSWTAWSGIKYNNFLRRNQNTLQMLLKNYVRYNLLWILPIYMIINILEMIFFICIGKFKIWYTYLKWWYYNIKILPKTLKKRFEIQSRRDISDSEVMKYMYNWSAKLHHLFNFFKNKYGE